MAGWLNRPREGLVPRRSSCDLAIWLRIALLLELHEQDDLLLAVGYTLLWNLRKRQPSRVLLMFE